MATSNYTPNLHLSAWADSDRPKRADFVSDNTIIDTQLGGHIANSGIHLTAQEKAKISEPYVSLIYSGTGESTHSFTLEFQPKAVFVYRRGVPFVKYSGGVNYVYAASGYFGHGASVGISITTNGVTVSQSAEASDGVKVCLNESGCQYTIIAFR